MAQISDEQFDLLLSRLDEMQPNSEVARLIAQGMSLGFSDEVEALLRTPFSGDDYKTIRDDIRSKIEGHRSRDPMGSMGYELLGAAVPAIATFGRTGPLSIANASRPLLQATKVGAVEGGASGIGMSEREGLESLKDAPASAAVGALFAPATNVAGGAIGSVTNSFMEFMRQRGSDRLGTVVENEISRLADQTGLTTDEIIQRINDGEIMADNPNLRMSVRSFMSQGGDPEARVREVIPARAESARAEAKEAVQVGLTDATDENVMKAALMKQDEWRAAESDGYKRVFNSQEGQPVSIPQGLAEQALDVLRRVPSALKEMDDLYTASKLVPLFKKGENGAIDLVRAPTLEDAEMIRRVASEAAQKAFTEGRGTLGSQLKGIELNLKQDLDNFSPDLANTRAGWSRMEKAREAFKAGKGAFTGDVEAFEITAESVMASGDEALVSAFREGVMSSINNKMAIGGSKRFLGKMANPETREGRVFLNVFPQDQQADVLRKLSKAGTTQESSELIIGGPTTQLTKAATDQQNLGIGVDEVTSALGGNLASGISVGMKAIKSLAPNLNNDQRLQITNVLLSDNPNFVREALQDSGKMAQLQQKVGDLVQMITAGSVGAASYSGGAVGTEITKGLLGEI